MNIRDLLMHLRALGPLNLAWPSGSMSEWWRVQTEISQELTKSVQQNHE